MNPHECIKSISKADLKSVFNLKFYTSAGERISEIFDDFICSAAYHLWHENGGKEPSLINFKQYFNEGIYQRQLHNMDLDYQSCIDYVKIIKKGLEYLTRIDAGEI
jgi:hypothetical protein